MFLKRGVENCVSLQQDEDDRFGFQVEVQAADHALNTEDKENMLHVALRYPEQKSVL